MASDFSIRAAHADDRDALRALLPRLAAFDLPPRRHPDDLWRGDEALLLRHLDGDAPQVRAYVAVAPAGHVVGLAFFSLRPELLSGAPSAHLEALAVAEDAQGSGVGSALLTTCEHAARDAGASSMTLHVFARNERARRLYEARGYSAELIREIRYLDDNAEDAPR